MIPESVIPYAVSKSRVRVEYNVQTWAESEHRGRKANSGGRLLLGASVDCPRVAAFIGKTLLLNDTDRNVAMRRM